MSRHNKLMVGWVLLASFLLLCLMVPGYYTYNFVAFFVMMIYAAIMWQNNSRSTASGIDRRTPWILLGLMSFALLFGSTRSFPEPKYPEVPPVKSLAQVPVTIDGLSPGMTRSEILQLKGEPNLQDLNHVLIPLELGTQEVAETIEMLLAEHPDIPEKAEVLDWREELSISPGPVDERRQMMVETMRESLFEKEEPRILFTDHSLATQDYESLLKSVEMSDGGSTTYLFLAGGGYEKVAGLLLEDTVQAPWWFPRARPARVHKIYRTR